MDIRPLATPAEFRAAEQFQLDVWGFDPREITPLTELVVAQKHGGLVLGAFDGDRLVGFLFGWIGRGNGRTYHYSRMTGVVPELRDRGLGLQMKLWQRRWALEQGYDLVCWTFDPLQSRNAHFNLRKLGVVCREYLVNFYGENQSRFNRGLETDRLLVEWWIASPRVLRCVGGEVPRADGLRVEIPENIDALKERDLEAARGWRSRVRKAVQAALADGHLLSGFENGRLVLERKPLEEVLK